MHEHFTLETPKTEITVVIKKLFKKFHLKKKLIEFVIWKKIIFYEIFFKKKAILPGLL
jgi:hypothetical protein